FRFSKKIDEPIGFSAEVSDAEAAWKRREMEKHAASASKLHDGPLCVRLYLRNPLSKARVAFSAARAASSAARFASSAAARASSAARRAASRSAGFTVGPPATAEGGAVTGPVAAGNPSSLPQ